MLQTVYSGLQVHIAGGGQNNHVKFYICLFQAEL